MSQIHRTVGRDELAKKFKALAPVIQAEIKAAMELSANEVCAFMRSLTKSKRVRESIGWTWDEVPTGKKAVLKGSGAGATITIYAGNDAAFFAKWLDRGTQPHSLQSGADVSRGARQGGLQHPGAKPRPYFGVAWRAYRPRVKRRITRAAATGAKKAAKSA